MSAQPTDPAYSDPGGGPAGEPGDAFPRVARYEREGLLGLGGMGRVYAARDRTLQRQVALKVAATPALAARLACEARVTAQLEHPGIVAVYDAGVEDGQAWYAMRMIRGRTLRDRIADCPDLAARLLLLPHLHAACQAVAYAHAMGIVHRDLKPANLMVGEFGETQVADWGLACPTEAASAAWARLAPEARAAGGTPGFMSPEQHAGAPARPTSDVYALGAALCELLSGTPGGASSGAAEAGEERLRALPPDAPGELVAIARRCLQTDATARYPSAVELADDVGRWLSGRRVNAYEYRPVELLLRLARAWRAPLTVAGVAFVLLAVAVVVGVRGTLQERARAEANLAVALAQQARVALTEDRTPEAVVLAAHSLRLAESPEARGVLAGASHERAVLVERIALPSVCQHHGVPSPDADRIACVADGRVEVWSLRPLQKVQSAEVRVTAAPVWVGDQLLLPIGSETEWLGEAGEGPRLPVGGLPVAGEKGVFLLAGPSVAYVGLDGSVSRFETCRSTRGSTAAAGDALLVGCSDGVLRSYSRAGVVTAEQVVADGPPEWSVLAVSDGRLLVGGLDGSVRTLELAGGPWGPRVERVSGAVRAVLAVPGEPQLLVLGERGGPRILNATLGGWAGSLPSGVAQLLAGRERGEVLTVGEFLDRWRLPSTPQPHVIPFSAGLSQVAVSPSGERVAAALGTGQIVERRVSDGAETGLWAWTPEVAKCVAYVDEDRLVAGAMGGGGRVLHRTGEAVPLDTNAVLRRLGRFHDGSFWALTFGSGLRLDRDLRHSTLDLAEELVDGSSSPDGRVAVLLDSGGGVWQSTGGDWTVVAQVPDGVAVDVADGGAPVVVARRREVCVDARCFPMADDVSDLAVHGGLAAVGTLAGEVHLISLATGRTTALLRGHAGRISSVEFGPDGRWLVSASWDHTARLWDLSALDEPAESLVERGLTRWGLGLEAALRGG